MELVWYTRPLVQVMNIRHFFPSLRLDSCFSILSNRVSSGWESEKTSFLVSLLGCINDSNSYGEWVSCVTVVKFSDLCLLNSFKCKYIFEPEVG